MKTKFTPLNSLANHMFLWGILKRKNYNKILLLRGLFLVPLFLLVNSFAIPVLAQNWVSTDPMNNPRWIHASVLLPSGRVLVTGGWFFGTRLKTAEIYDPNASDGLKWSFAASMPTGHRRHSILLTKPSPSTGKVLVVGEDSPTTSAYLFDENAGSQGTWTSTGNSPLVRRFGAALIELPNGKILYPGGYCGGLCATFNSAELYDPVTDTWSFTGSLASQRTSFTATLLTVGPNTGKVLVTGGSIRIGQIAHSSSELYDPTTETWSPAASMNSPRVHHQATMLPDGRILVSGGRDATLTPVATADIYDPVINTWTSIASMGIARSRHTSTGLPDGRILVVGGVSLPDFSGVTPTAEIFDPTTQQWIVVGSMMTPRAVHGTTLLPSGVVLVTGGTGDGNIPLGSAELFNPIALQDCSNFKCGAKNDKVMVCHIPPGNPNKQRTKCINPEELAIHLEHGDYCGPCSSSTARRVQGLNGTEINGLEVKYWPNPSNSFFNLKLNKDDKVNAAIYVYNINGRLVYQKTNITSNTYQFGESLKSGIYFVKLTLKDKSQLIKLIKY